MNLRFSSYFLLLYIYMFIICVSSSCFILFEFVYPWNYEYVLKCSYLAWIQCKYFTSHLQPFKNAFQNAQICWKALTKGETLNSCDVTFQIYCNDIFFQLKWSTNQYSKIKRKYVLKNAGNGAGFTLQTKYLVDTVIILINAGSVNLIFGV